MVGGLINGGTAVIASILMENRPSVSTDLSEDFLSEAYRLEGNNYSLQADIAVNPFSSLTNRAATTDLIVCNALVGGRPSLPNGGNFSTITNTAATVNYSAISGQKTFYRKFKNTTGADRSNLRLTMSGAGAIVTSLASLGANANFLVEVKVPGTTGWAVLSNFTANPIGNGSGILNTLTIPFSPTIGTNTNNDLTFGSQFVPNGSSIVLRITADAMWSGSLSAMSITWQ